MSQISWRPTFHLFILEELISGFNFSIFKMTQAHWTLGQHFVNGKTCLQVKCNAYSGTPRWKRLTCSAGDTKPWAEPSHTTTKEKQQAYLSHVYRTDLRGIRGTVHLHTPGDVCQRNRPTCITDFVQQALFFFVPGVQVLIRATGQAHTVRGRGAFRRQVCSLNGEDNVSVKNKTMTINADQNQTSWIWRCMPLIPASLWDPS